MSVRRRAIRARMERNAAYQRGVADQTAGLRKMVELLSVEAMARPGAPHPLDNEWRVFGNYYKLHYDVSDLMNRDILHRQVWPNAGKIAGFNAGECLVRISELHPYTEQTQLNAETIERMERNYGKWSPSQITGAQ